MWKIRPTSCLTHRQSESEPPPLLPADLSLSLPTVPALPYSLANTPPPRRGRPQSYILLNEARSGSSWLQEISQTHPGVRVQFELGLAHADDALACRQCTRPDVPDSKRARPPRLHPPLACGLTAFGSANRVGDVAALASRREAVLVLLLRINHVAHAVSLYRHVRRTTNRPQLPPLPGLSSTPTAAAEAAAAGAAAADAAPVPWDADELWRAVEESRAAYTRLLAFPAAAGRPAHLLFYEDLKREPAAVWAALQRFLGLSPAAAPTAGDAAGGGGGLEALEKRSSDRAGVLYLGRLGELQAELGKEEWGDMLLDPGFDESADAAAAFAEACRLHPAAALSWRGAASCTATPSPPLPPPRSDGL
jgi:hypothetical protein